ncbi:alpha/beta hydrolase [Flagellimonas hymeniacidonis]|uniref:Alpha/beta hydrolase n=1 Tax=Flagellimonas hymeniacidonis TaxID=2603628 RepID=A0A5C8V3A4_9FLAO|nr:alpha/beta hydrolase [Flagellimonas hymeniacidonis]TXN35629.1 alpha/beta hydrolase [Flagellimonas hymeniacidonis]
MTIRKRFKKRYLLAFLVFGYLLFANSCMTMRTSPKRTAAFFQEKQMDFIDSNIEIQDRNLHYIQTGNKDAQTLVFIHGSPGSWDAYKAYLSDSLLSNKFRLVAIDRPGFGKSEFRRSMALKPQALILMNFWNI